jgi:Na+/citrate or Na+/malate symporter
VACACVILISTWGGNEVSQVYCGLAVMVCSGTCLGFIGEKVNDRGEEG